MPRARWLLLLGLFACRRGPLASPLADLPPQDSIRVDFYWQLPDSVPAHTLTDSLQIAAVMQILQAPGDWHFERAHPFTEQRLFLTDAQGQEVRVGFCPRTIVARAQDDRFIRSIGAATYDSLMRLTGSRPYSYEGDTGIDRRERLCHIRGHGFWDNWLNVALFFPAMILAFVGCIRLLELVFPRSGGEHIRRL